MEKYIENLKWRYSTKQFDTNKKVSLEDLNEIIEVFRLTASSFWLQPWKLFIIDNYDIKKQIMLSSWSQNQVLENSSLLVFAKPTNIDEELINKHISKTAKLNNLDEANLSWYKELLLNFVNKSDSLYLNSWAREQVFISLWNILSFLAYKKIDSCPIWWFDKDSVDKILNLKEKWFESVVLLPIWYRSEEDKYSKKIKSRFDKEDIYEIIN